MRTENKENLRGENAGPVGKPASTPFFKIFAIVFFISITALSYVTYKKISQFLSFLTGEIDSVTAPFKYGNFSSSGTYPIPEEDENENDEAAAEAVHIQEDEGEEAERTEISAEDSAEQSRLESSASAASADSTAEPVSSVFGQDAENSPRPFPRTMNSVESAGMSAAGTAADGFFKGLNEFSMQDNIIGLTKIVFKDSKVYQFSLYPKEELYENADEEKSAGTAAESFNVIIKKVQGAYYYNSKKDIILAFRDSFVKACLANRKNVWKYAELDGYAYGCSGRGFNAVAVNALGKPGIPADKEPLF